MKDTRLEDALEQLCPGVRRRTLRTASFILPPKMTTDEADDPENVKDNLIIRAAELLTRYITVAPPEYHQDLRKWLQDAGLDEVKK